METVKQIHVGNTIVGGNGSLFVMAGPCVIEDPERTLNIGRKMKEICERLGLPYIFKASFDKANRSSYTSYRGPGLTEGLRILGDIKRNFKFPSSVTSTKSTRWKRLPKSWMSSRFRPFSAGRRIWSKRLLQRVNASM